MYINDLDLKTLRSVEDKKLNELFQEALSYDKTLMISETSIRYKKWFCGKSHIKKYYFVYHEELDKNGKSLYQAREMFCGSGEKRIVEAYLYGIINGSIHTKEYNK